MSTNGLCPYTICRPGYGSEGVDESGLSRGLAEGRLLHAKANNVPADAALVVRGDPDIRQRVNHAVEAVQPSALQEQRGGIPDFAGHR